MKTIPRKENDEDGCSTSLSGSWMLSALGRPVLCSEEGRRQIRK